MKYYLGADIGSSKTEILVADDLGHVVGLGRSGPGNQQTVGYEGMYTAMRSALDLALAGTGISVLQISGAGLGISGFDWPSDRPRMVEVITRLGLQAPSELHNDAVLGLVAGSQEGWGISVVSGSGCNCWGWNQDRSQVGRVTGFGDVCGEAAGGSELVYHAMQRVAQAWTRRGPETALSDAFIDHTGARDLEDLLEGYTTGRISVDGGAAPLVFQIAEKGDLVAGELVQWAGHELGELAKAVIRQLNFQQVSFDVVLVGSMFAAGEQLVVPMRDTILQLAPRAHLVRLEVPPAAGAVLLGLQASGSKATLEFRENLFRYFH